MSRRTRAERAALRAYRDTQPGRHPTQGEYADARAHLDAWLQRGGTPPAPREPLTTLNDELARITARWGAALHTPPTTEDK